MIDPHIVVLALAILAFPVSVENAPVLNAAPIQAQQRKPADIERDRAYLRQEFQKNFKKLQLLGQGLLRNHETAKLSPDHLNRDAKAIQKCARTLRTLQALGDMAKPVNLESQLASPGEFDASIRKLAKLIYDYAHNPVHQSSKVFNTIQAEEAQTNLLAIINLSKILETRAKNYTVAAVHSN